MNKKGFIPILAIGLILVLIGMLGVTMFRPATAELTREDIKDIIQEIKTAPDVIDKPDEERDNDIVSPNPPATPDNTPEEIETKPDETCKVSGKWEGLWVKQKTRIDSDMFGDRPKSKAVAIFRYTGDCVSDVYIEAGINPATKKPLAIKPTFMGAIASKPSWCDENKNYAGHLFKGVKPGKRLLAVDLNPKTPKAEGNYELKVGAYTGCLGKKTTDLANSKKWQSNTRG